MGVKFQVFCSAYSKPSPHSGAQLSWLIILRLVFSSHRVLSAPSFYHYWDKNLLSTLTHTPLISRFLYPDSWEQTLYWTLFKLQAPSPLIFSMVLPQVLVSFLKCMHSLIIIHWKLEASFGRSVYFPLCVSSLVHRPVNSSCLTYSWLLVLFNQSGRPPDCFCFPVPALWSKHFLQAQSGITLGLALIAFPPSHFSGITVLQCLIAHCLESNCSIYFPCIFKRCFKKEDKFNPCYSILAEASLKEGFLTLVTITSLK